MDKKINVQTIGFLPMLTLVFITLKLCHVISWPWLWVLAPLWIPLAILFSILTICGACYLLVCWFESSNKQ